MTKRNFSRAAARTFFFLAIFTTVASVWTTEGVGQGIAATIVGGALAAVIYGGSSKW